MTGLPLMSILLVLLQGMNLLPNICSFIGIVVVAIWRLNTFLCSGLHTISQGDSLVCS